MSGRVRRRKRSLHKRRTSTPNTERDDRTEREREDDDQADELERRRPPQFFFFHSPNSTGQVRPRVWNRRGGEGSAVDVVVVVSGARLRSDSDNRRNPGGSSSRGVRRNTQQMTVGDCSVGSRRKYSRGQWGLQSPELGRRGGGDMWMSYGPPSPKPPALCVPQHGGNGEIIFFCSIA